MAFNRQPRFFDLDTSTTYNMEKLPRFADYPYFPQIHEILSPFFRSHNLIPTWHDADDARGSVNKETGLWTGVLGLVSEIYVLLV